MPRSTNSFTKNRTSAFLNEASGSFTTNRSTAFLAESSNTPSLNRVTLNILNKNGNYGWDGENVTSNLFGYDDLINGDAFGIGSFGGIVHFKNLTQS